MEASTRADISWRPAVENARAVDGLPVNTGASVVSALLDSRRVR